MEGAQATLRRPPAWLAGLLPLLVLGAAIGAFIGFGAPGLDRNGVPAEELTVEKTTLRPGHDRGDGAQRRPRPGGHTPGAGQRLVRPASRSPTRASAGWARGKVKVDYPWVEGEAYAVTLLTATGGTVDATVDVAAETPGDGPAGFLGLMALVGLYVGVIPVAIGMLWLPWVRAIDPRYVQLPAGGHAGPAGLPGHRRPAGGHGVRRPGGAGVRRRGPGLPGRGGGLPGPDRRGRAPQGAAGGDERPAPWRLALLVALGIGLHNLGEGLAIGSAYAIGSLALGASLIVGFALHNTTEGLAIVSPVAREEDAGPASLRRLVGLGTLAGAPAVLGAWLGASAFNTSLAAFMFGLGAGAIAQVIVQMAPSVRDDQGRLANPLTVGGVLTGLALMYATGLLISL